MGDWLLALLQRCQPRAVSQGPISLLADDRENQRAAFALEQGLPGVNAAAEKAAASEERAVEEAESAAPEAPPQRNAPLERGYYVQIASYLDSASVRRLMESYSARYPLAFVDSPGSTGPSATKRALIGRLRPDETGAVLEFFRKEGFRDAFVFVVN